MRLAAVEIWKGGCRSGKLVDVELWKRNGRSSKLTNVEIWVGEARSLDGAESAHTEVQKTVEKVLRTTPNIKDSYLFTRLRGTPFCAQLRGAS